MRKRLLVVWHGPGASVARMKNAVVAGALAEDAVDVVCLRAQDADADDVLAADGYVFGTPENFGALAGATKDFFDRVYPACEGRIAGRPFAAFVKGRHDGTGALRQLGPIVTGLRLRQASEPIVVVGPLERAALEHCEELGAALAAGLALGVF